MCSNWVLDYISVIQLGVGGLSWVLKTLTLSALWSKKIDYYRRHRIPISYLRAAVQNLIMNELHFFSSGQTIVILFLVGLFAVIYKNLVLFVKSG